MAKYSNPYRASSHYNALFGYLMEHKEGVTFEELYNFSVTELELSESAALASISVVTSPNKLGEGRGDARGNMSAQGDKYYVSKELTTYVTPKGKAWEAQAMFLHFRRSPLAPLKRA